MQPNQSSQPELTIQQRLNIALWLSECLAVTVLPLLRRRVGLRTLKQPRVPIVLLLLLLVGNPLADDAFNTRYPRIPSLDTKPSFSIFPDSVPAPKKAEKLPDMPFQEPEKWFGRGWLGIFAMLSLFLAGRQVALRQRELRQGITWHSYHRGISVFSSLRRGHAGTWERFGDPLICIVLGAIIWHFLSPPLGGWLIFSGLALRAVESMLHKRNVERNLDAIDGTIDSQTLSEVVEQFEQHPTTTKHTRGDVEILHTALSPDVEALIARRKKRKPPKN